MPKGSQNQGELRGSDKNILPQNSLAQPANPWFALRGTKRLFLTISFFSPSSIKSIAGSRSFEKSSSHSLDFSGSCCSLWMGCGKISSVGKQSWHKQGGGRGWTHFKIRKVWEGRNLKEHSMAQPSLLQAPSNLFFSLFSAFPLLSPCSVKSRTGFQSTIWSQLKAWLDCC